MCRAQSDPNCPGGRRCEVDAAARNAARRATYAQSKDNPVQLHQRHSAPVAALVPEGTADIPTPPAPAPHPTRPHIPVQGRWVVGLSEDPRTARRQAAARERIGAEHRDAAGRILWGTITDPQLRSLRPAVEKRPPRTIRLPAGLVDVAGRIDRERLATMPPAMQARIRELVRDNLG